MTVFESRLSKLKNNAALPFIPDSYYIPKKFFDVNVNAPISLALAVIKEKKDPPTDSEKFINEKDKFKKYFKENI